MTVVQMPYQDEKVRAKARTKALEVRAYYDAFLQVGFTPEQAWELIHTDFLDDIFK